MRDNYWQARLKMPTGKWHRITTKQTNLDEAEKIACEHYDEMKLREKNNMALLTKKFSDVGKVTVMDLKEQLDSGYGKVTYWHYIGAIENYL